MNDDGTPAQQSKADTGAPAPVSVEIYDQIYHLRGTDPEHIQRIAAVVSDRMRAVAAQGNTVDSLRVAVLAALNIADELLLQRAKYDALAAGAGRTQETLRSRADTLAGMLDEVLDPARRAG